MSRDRSDRPPTDLARLREPVVLADVRWYLDGRSGRAAFEAEHLPGARFVDLDADLSDHSQPASEGRHPLPAPAAFAAAMGRLGIGDGTTVVAYDDSGGGTAGRLVFMLRVLGHDAALLDGGLAAATSLIGSEIGPSPALAPAPVHAAAVAGRSLRRRRCGGRSRGARRTPARRPQRRAVPGRAGGGRSAPRAHPRRRERPWQGNLDDAGRFLPADRAQGAVRPARRRGRCRLLLRLGGVGVRQPARARAGRDRLHEALRRLVVWVVGRSRP